MAAITYGAPARTDLAVRATAAKKQGFWSRFWNAMIQAQMRKAQREIELHRHLLPEGYELAGDKLTAKSEDQLPFVRR